MPTTRPRYPVTETDDIAAVLDEAAVQWPGETRARLIVHVLLDWQAHQGGPARARAREQLVGSIPGSAAMYEPADDWPT